MVTLELRFAGLNVFTKESPGCRVYVTDARRATSAPDHSALTAHEPMLIVERGSLVRRDQEPGGFPRHTRLVLENGPEVDYAPLWGNREVRVRSTSEPRDEPAADLEPPDWLPCLGEIDLRVDRNKPLRHQPLGATFLLDRGRFLPGEPIDAAWQGHHVGSCPRKLRMWTTLEYEAEADGIYLDAGHGGGWTLKPPADQKIIAWVGNVPVGGDEHKHARDDDRHAPDIPVHHFKWLYVHTPMRPTPSGLAYPVVRPRKDSAPEVKIPMTTTYCPDGQYP